MRITDEGGEEGGFNNRKPSPSLMESIKAKSQVGPAAESEDTAAPKWERATGTPAWEKPPQPAQETGKISADVQSAKLKSLLGKIKST
jgi:hypothetical protein